jgi:hypothetical protein
MALTPVRDMGVSAVQGTIHGEKRVRPAVERPAIQIRVALCPDTGSCPPWHRAGVPHRTPRKP